MVGGTQKIPTKRRTEKQHSKKSEFDNIYQAINENRPFLDLEVCDSHQTYHSVREKLLTADLMQKAKKVKEFNDQNNSLACKSLVSVLEA